MEIKYLHISLITTLCVLSLQFMSCNENTQNRQKLIVTENIITELKGKQIFIPDSVAFIYKDSIYKTNILNAKNKKFTIISIINGDCNICVESLQKWKDDFIDELDTGKVAYNFYISTEKTYNFMIAIYPQINLDLPLILDTSEYFIRQNKLDKYDDRFRTFLLDKDNKIILTGNPIHNAKIKNLFIQEIKKDTPSNKY